MRHNLLKMVLVDATVFSAFGLVGFSISDLTGLIVSLTNLGYVIYRLMKDRNKDFTNQDEDKKLDSNG